MSEQSRLHSLNLTDREKLTLTGISEVVTFDEQTVILRTDLGDLTVQGQLLQLKELNPQGGSVCIRGQIDAISYDQGREAQGWLGRLFR